MKLRTSLFNKTVLKKDITRFAPVWGLYTVFMLMTLFLIWAEENSPARFATNASYIMMAMGIVNFVYGGLCALLLFGDLFTTKMCNALHAMPLRREGWFLTHLTAGILFCIGPNCLGAVLAAAILQEYCYLAFVWLAIMVCQYLFFFGTGAFCAQCAGNKLGAAAVYGLFNLLSVLVAFLVETFYAPVLYGIEPDWEKLCSYSPVVGFTLSPYVSVEYDNMRGAAVFEGFIPENWQFLFLSLAVGLALLAAAVLLYRKRSLESAGDFIAVKPAAPVFLVIYTLCVGAALYFIADLVAGGSEYVFLLIGFAIGFFTGWMLLEKKVNVFKPKKFLGFGILTLVFFFTVALTWLDPLGITRYVPKAEQVVSVDICHYASDYYLDNHALTLTEPEDIEAILTVHSDLVENRNAGETSVCLRLRYTLDSGAKVDRQYYIDPTGKNATILRPYFSDFSYVTRHESVDDILEQFYSVEFYSHGTLLPNIQIRTPAEHAELGNVGKYNGEDWIFINSQDTAVIRGLLEAIRADCDAGNMVQLWDFHTGESEGYMTIYLISDYSWDEGFDLTIYSDCTNTIQYLQALRQK